MKTIRYDAAVVGGGPAGLIAAEGIASAGHSVIVYEEHENLGVPDHCAGLLSAPGLNLLGLKPPSEVVQNHVSGARIYSPSGHSIFVERGRREAFVVDRRRFDSWLGTLAQDAGASVETGTKVKAVSQDEDMTQRLTLRSLGNDLEIQASVIVNGEGSRCILSKSLGIPIVPRKNKYPAFQFEVKGVDIDEDLVEMFYGRRIAPGFFAWIIPIGDGRARVGLAAKNHAKRRLTAAIRHHPVMKDKLQSAKIEREMGGVVLVGMPVNRTSTDSVVVVGDAAGIVKPTTGGGVILGGIAAQLAATTVAESINKGDTSANALMRYDQRWRGQLLNELRAMSMAQRVISSLSDKGVDSLIKDAKEHDLVATVREEGDMDMQGRVIGRLLTKPLTLWAGLKAIRYLNPLL
jgi:geranylgeranyl reductase family protein